MLPSFRFALALAVLAVAGAAAGANRTSSAKNEPEDRIVALVEGAIAFDLDARKRLTGPGGARQPARTKAIALLGRARESLRRAQAISAKELASPELTHELDLALTAAREREAVAQSLVRRQDVEGARKRILQALRHERKALVEVAEILVDDFECKAEVALSTDPSQPDDDVLTATCPALVSSVVIGASSRATARTVASEPLPITRVSKWAVVSAGQLYTGDCALAKGVVTCAVAPPMQPGLQFLVGFGPKLPDGTKLLAVFRSPNGKRAVMRMRVG